MKNRSRSLPGACAALVLGALAFSVPAAAQETISYPSRSSDLEPDSYWGVPKFDEGCCVLDLNVWRWDGNSWEKNTSMAQNSHDFDWGLPLYAPANGEVISCWRNFPDDPAPGVNPPNNNIFGGGNHVVILTDANNVISINHLQSGTIPASLCPVNADSTQYPAGSLLSPQGNWRPQAYVAEEDRVRVTEGDYIGDVGSSGASSNPHLHMSMHDVTGTDGWGREILSAGYALPFRHGWAARFEQDEQPTASSWYRLRGEGLEGDPACADYVADSPECGFRHIHASPYLRRFDATAGDVLGGDVLFLSSNRAVTATISQDDGLLDLIAWDLVGITEWEREGDLRGDEVKAVHLSEPVGDYVLAALHMDDDTLEMVAYHVNFLGDFTEVDRYSAGTISELQVATVGTPTNMRTVTAVVISTGEMKLIAWDLAFSGSTVEIDRLGEIATLGDATRIAVSRGLGFNGVYTALRNDAGYLMVIPYALSNDALTFTRGDDVTSIAVSPTARITVAPLAQGVAVAMQNASDHLHLRTWSASGGDVDSLQDTASAGEVSEIQLLTAPHGDSNLTTVVRDGNGNMQLIGWAIDDDGDNIRRLGSSKTGGVSGIAADIVSRSYVGLDPRDMIATLARTSSNDDLLLIAWDTNLVNP